MHISAAHQGSERMVNQEQSNGKLPPCVHCQESNNGLLSSPRVVLDLMVLSITRKVNENFVINLIIQSRQNEKNLKPKNKDLLVFFFLSRNYCCELETCGYKH